MAEADAFVAQGEYKQAASLYARCSKPFEEVALVFVDQHERDALRLYLTLKLSNLARNVILIQNCSDLPGFYSTDYGIDMGYRIIPG